MKRQKITKILIIISIVIIFLGIIIGLNISNELINYIPNEAIYVDGSDFSGLAQFIGIIGSKIIGVLIIYFSILIDIAIWFIYGVVLIILKIIAKINYNKNNIE